MKPTKVATCVAVLTCSLLAQSAWAANYYWVASDGTGHDTANSGTLNSPWATLAKASSVAGAGDTILLKAGNTWAETLKLKNGVSYGRYPSNATTKPVITGSAYVGGLAWTLDTNNVYVADVSGLVSNEYDPYGNLVQGGISQLFLNGQRLTRARYPNANGGTYGKGLNRFLPAGEATPSPEVKTHLQTVDLNRTVKLANGTTPTVADLLAGKDLLNADVFFKNNDWIMTRYKSTTAQVGSNKTMALAAENKNFYDDNHYADDRSYPHQLDWPGVTDEAVTAGYGYWLEGKRWMLDAENEWHYDEQTKRLYVRMQGNVSPSGKALTAATRLHAISGFNVQSVNIDNIEARETRSDTIFIDGFNVRLSSLALSNVSAINAGRKGIFVINTTRPGATTAPVGAISNALVEDSINEGIDLSGDRRWFTTRTHQINVTGSTVRRAGQAYYARGAILLGHRGNAENNVVDGSSFVGIHAGKRNLIRYNTVKNTCLAFDDCGAIYTSGSYYPISQEEPGSNTGPYDVYATISNNFVMGTLVSDDRVDGSGASNGHNVGARKTTAGGIYLDDFSSVVSISGNHVRGTDLAIALHQASNTTIENNDTASNRRALHLQANISGSYPMQGNVVTGNVFATNSSDPLIYQQNTFGSTANLATLSNNRYASYRAPHFVFDDAQNATVRLKTFKQWQDSGKDSGSSLYATSFRLQSIPNAAQLTPSGSFTAVGNNNGWYTTAGQATLPAEGSTYLTIARTESTEILGPYRRFHVTPPEGQSIQKGDKYWLTFNAQADAGAELVVGFQRGDWPWDSLSVPVSVPVTSTTQSYTRLIVAEESATGATLPFAFHVNKDVAAANSKVRISAVSLKKAEVVTGNAQAVGFYNPNATGSVLFGCPNTNTALCSQYVDIRDTTAPVTFPLSLTPRTSKVVVLSTPAWRDFDRDGIPGDASAANSTIDLCGNSSQSVKENGCAYP